jgi:c(7)-type cytochrome triheme protein
MGILRTSLVVVGAVMFLAGPVRAAGKDPAEYGRVVISSASGKAGLAPAVFDHWLHRAKYTCRLCHVDIAFAMKANGTGITAADNMKGVYCGVCHNGKMQSGGKAVFVACSEDRSDMKRCEQCHVPGKSVNRDAEFAALTAKFPKDKFGNGVNWEKAAEDGLIQPVDYIEGVSIKRPSQTIQKDFSIKPKEAGKAEILFSHRKHVLWNGCEVCHPEIFMGGRRGATKYSMKEIEQGKFCGVCHTTVAFPLEDCSRCHSQPAK